MDRIYEIIVLTAEHYRSSTMTEQQKQQIDSDAEREAMALGKQRKLEQPRRLRLQIGSYSSIEFDKLFVIDKLHKN